VTLKCDKEPFPVTYNYIGLNDKEEWNKLQNEIIDDMIKLEKAFKKYISVLKI